MFVEISFSLTCFKSFVNHFPEEKRYHDDMIDNGFFCSILKYQGYGKAGSFASSDSVQTHIE